MKRLAFALLASMAFAGSAAPKKERSSRRHRPTRHRGLFPVAHYVINGTERKMVAVTAWRSKTIFNLEPGKHMLMATQGNLGHPMEANVEAGKRYYVLVRFIYAQGMQLRPLRTGGESNYRTDIPDFAEWWKITRYVEMTPAAVPTFESEKFRPMIAAE